MRLSVMGGGILPVPHARAGREISAAAGTNSFTRAIPRILRDSRIFSRAAWRGAAHAGPQVNGGLRFLVSAANRRGYYRTSFCHGGEMNEEVRQAAEAAARDPWAFHWLTYSWVALMSGWGGLVRFLSMLRQEDVTLGRALLELFSGLVTSIFVGVLTFYACEQANFEPLSTAICVAITGYMGGEAIRMIQSGLVARLRAAWFAAFTPPTDDKE